jgi:hypothetical protein
MLTDKGLAHVRLMGAALLVVFSAGSASTQLSKPVSVSVVGSGRRTLVYGEPYIFQVRLKPTPEGYDHDRGFLVAEFQRVEPPKNPQSRYVTGGLASGERFTIGGRAAFTNDVSDYNVTIETPDDLAPGKYKLTNLQMTGEPTTIPEDVSFELVDTLRAVHMQVDAPPTVEAGHTLNVKVTLDEPPEGGSQYCTPTVEATLKANNATAIYIGGFEPKERELSHTFSHYFESDLNATHYAVKITLGAAVPSMGGCRISNAIGNQDLDVKLLPSRTIVRPTSVAVIINPSQAQLFSAEAAKINADADHLDSSAAPNDSDAGGRLQSALLTALKRVDETETTFKAYGKQNSNVPEVGVFFDDIRATYGNALKAVSENRQPGKSPLMLASNSTTSPVPTKDRAAKAVIGSLHHNADAYTTAVSLNSLTFDLLVKSFPEGAKILYAREADPSFETYADPTNATINNLPLAIWILKFQMDGKKEATKTHNPFRERNHVVEAEMVPESKH